MATRRRSDLAPVREAHAVSPLLRWFLAGPILGFFLTEALINFRAARPVLGGLHVIAMTTWLGLLVILDLRLL